MLAAILTTETLWRNALAAIPVACAVALLCRWLPCRPSTRHLLWLVVLLVLLAPPGAPRLSLPWAASQDAPAVEIASGTKPTDATAAPAPVAKKTLAAAPSEPTVTTAAAPPSIPLPPPPAISATRASSAATTLNSPPGRASARETAPARAAEHPRPTVTASTRADRPRQVAPPRSETWTATSTYAERPREAPAAATTVIAAAPGPEPIPAAAPAVHHALAAPAAPAAALAGNPAPVWADPPPAASPGWLRDARAGLDLWLTKAVALRDAVAALPALPPLVWAGGSVLVLLVSGTRILRCRRLFRSGAPATDDVVRSVAAAAATLGLRRVPRVYMVDARVSPMVWCGRSPRLILPTALWSELDPAGRDAVIHHELAHLRRRDHWVCWAQAAASLLYWWHPIVWLVGRRLRDEADLCCDAWVTTLFPTHRRAYAQALLDTRRFISDSRQAPPALGLGATTNRARHFARRLTMVMTQRPTPRRSLPGMFLAAGLCAAGVLSAPLLACPPEDEAQPSKAPSAQGGGGQGGVYGGLVAPTAPRAPKAPKAPKPPRPARAPRAAAVTTPHIAPPAPPEPPAAGQWSKTVQVPPEAAQSTYEQHMAERNRARAGAVQTTTPRGAVTTARPGLPPAAVAMPAQPTMPAPPAMPARPAMPGQHGAFAPTQPAGGDQHLEQRMERLERRLDEMNQRMDRMLQRLERMSAAPGEPQFFATPDPISPSLVAALAADPAGGPGSRAIVIVLGDNNEIRAYSVGHEHLGALAALVEQSGSPLAVQQGGSADYAKLADLAAIQGQVHGEIAKELALKQYAQAADLSALAGRRAESVAALAELRALSGSLKSGHAAQARALLEGYRARAEAYSRTAEQLQERADAMAERADEMAEALDESRERAESLTGRAKEAALDKSATLEAAIKELRRAAEQLREQAEALAGQADELSDEADQAADEQDEAGDPEPAEAPSEDGR